MGGQSGDNPPLTSLVRCRRTMMSSVSNRSRWLATTRLGTRDINELSKWSLRWPLSWGSRPGSNNAWLLRHITAVQGAGAFIRRPSSFVYGNRQAIPQFLSTPRLSVRQGARLSLGWSANTCNSEISVYHREGILGKVFSEWKMTF